MRFREFANASKDPGDWYPHPEDPDVELLVRGIPASDEDRIRREAGAQAKQAVRLLGRGHSEVDIDTEKERVIARQRAAFALLDTRNKRAGAVGYEVVPGDEDAAKAYAKATGKPVNPGDAVVLDGHWTADVKDHFFREHSDQAGVVINIVDGIRTAKTEASKAATKN